MLFKLWVVLQALIFGQHDFAIIGDNNAAALFNVNPTTGALITTNSLFADSELTYFVSTFSQLLYFI